MKTQITKAELLATLLLALSALYATSARAEQYAVQISATFDMGTITTFDPPPATSIWGIPASAGNYTVTSSFTFDTAGAAVVQAGSFNDSFGGLSRQYDWYGILPQNISGFSVQFGSKTWNLSNLRSSLVSSYNASGSFISSASAPLWFAPDAGIVAFNAWAVDADTFVNAFYYSQAEGGQGLGVTNAWVTERNAYVFSQSITTTIQAVPEPEAWGLMLAGLALVGVAARRRNR